MMALVDLMAFVLARTLLKPEPGADEVIISVIAFVILRSRRYLMLDGAAAAPDRASRRDENAAGAVGV